jgi:hypothetical protein
MNRGGQPLLKPIDMCSNGVLTELRLDTNEKLYICVSLYNIFKALFTVLNQGSVYLAFDIAMWLLSKTASFIAECNKYLLAYFLRIIAGIRTCSSYYGTNSTAKSVAHLCKEAKVVS